MHSSKGLSSWLKTLKKTSCYYLLQGKFGITMCFMPIKLCVKLCSNKSLSLWLGFVSAEAQIQTGLNFEFRIENFMHKRCCKINLVFKVATFILRAKCFHHTQLLVYTCTKEQEINNFQKFCLCFCPLPQPRCFYSDGSSAGLLQGLSLPNMTFTFLYIHLNFVEVQGVLFSS